jgi:hypothetical protein
MRLARTVVFSSLLIAFITAIALDAQESPDLNHINSKFLMSLDDVQKIHASKDSLGPALSGTASWRNFVGIIESRIKAAGAVDLVKHTFTFDRWSTTEFPDTSGWSLVSDGKPLKVASYGANSGSTPDAGVTAELAFVDLGAPDREAALSKMNIAGKIVVFQTVPETEKTPPGERIYEYPGDYLYLSNPESFPDPRAPTKVTRTVTMRAEMRQHSSQIEKLIAGQAAGAVFAFDASYDRLAGLYTFGVPANHQMPTLYVDRVAGRQLVADAKAGKKATLKLHGKVEPSETWQIIAYLPGRHYGTEQDQQIMFTTHTDGPSISQDDGGFGLLGVAEYFAHIPKAQRPRTLMFFFDNRHYMPGAERAFAKQNYLEQHPEIWKKVVATIGMEHLGQMEFAEKGEVFKPTGLMEHSRLHATNNDKLVELAIKAVKDNRLRRVTVEQVDRPGVHGASQGTWFGLGAVGRTRGLPAFATMGDMGAYWGTSARLARFDAKHFVDQVATMAQLAGELMVADLETLKPKPRQQPSQFSSQH